jgi:hypothetical protein
MVRIQSRTDLDTQYQGLEISKHAGLRAQQRGIPTRGIGYVYQHGQCLYRTGIEFYCLMPSDVPAEDMRDASIQRLIGTVVLVAEGYFVLTVYKCSKPLRDIRRKCKYGSRQRDGRSGSGEQMDSIFPELPTIQA